MNVIKLNDLSRWNPLGTANAIRFQDGPFRRVRLNVNCEMDTALFIRFAEPAGAGPRFLTVAPRGVSVIEFRAGGAFEIAAESVEWAVFWHTAEDEPTAYQSDGESFTTIHERAPRNEALEWVMFQSQMNEQAREKRLRAEFDERLAAMEAKYDKEASGVHGGTPPEPQKPEKPVPAAGARKHAPAASGNAPKPAPGDGSAAGGNDDESDDGAEG
nr:MAG: hypothetical protein [Microvirus sp.]